MPEFHEGDKIRVTEERFGAYRITAVGEENVLARHFNSDFDEEIRLRMFDIEHWVDREL